MSKIKKAITKKPSSSLSVIAKKEKLSAWELNDRGIQKRVQRINKDFQNAFKALQNHTDTVTFFGSARFGPRNPYYEQARALATKISHELKLTIVSGGGGGIMEAANRGANEACLLPDDAGKKQYDANICGTSVGLTIELPKEQVSNDYAHHTVDFYYFYSRKVALAYTARAFVYFPGGYGTLDELFEIVTLKQTGKIPPIPIILTGVRFWRPLILFLEKTVHEYGQAIGKRDLKLFTLTDDHEEIVDIIARHPRRALK